MKKFFVLILALIMLLTLTACGQNTNATPTVESTEVTTNDTTESTNDYANSTQESTNNYTDSTQESTQNSTNPSTEQPATKPTEAPATPPATTPPTTTPSATIPPTTACSHTWIDATCTTAKTCSRCGTTEGSAKGHVYIDEKCNICGIPKFSEGLNCMLVFSDYCVVLGIGTCKDTVIIIPNNLDDFPVTHIAAYAFENCTSLTGITIPSSVTNIGMSAFENCTSLTSIAIPEGVTSIGTSTFEDCTSLTSVTIPNSVTDIDVFAFGGCTSLTSITIPSSVTSIGSYAFDGCTNLTSITYTGTTEQWATIEKGVAWSAYVPAEEIVCTNGTISLSN